MDAFSEGRAKDRQRISQALHGEIDGKPATREQCDQLILQLYDHSVLMAKGAIASVRALDKILKAHDVQITLQEYLDAVRQEEDQGISFS